MSRAGSLSRREVVELLALLLAAPVGVGMAFVLNALSMALSVG